MLQYPEPAEQVASAMVNRFAIDMQPKPDFIASPAIGGIVIGQEVARAIGVRHIFVEKNVNGIPTLRRGFEVEPGEKFIVVEDVVTTGKSTGEVLKVLREFAAEPIAILAVVDRSGEREMPFGNTSFISLAKLDIATYRPEDCPLCAMEIPLVKPGSRKTEQ